MSVVDTGVHDAHRRSLGRSWLRPLSQHGNRTCLILCWLKGKQGRRLLRPPKLGKVIKNVQCDRELGRGRFHKCDCAVGKAEDGLTHPEPGSLGEGCKTFEFAAVSMAEPYLPPGDLFHTGEFVRRVCPEFFKRG